MNHGSQVRMARRASKRSDSNEYENHRVEANRASFNAHGAKPGKDSTDAHRSAHEAHMKALSSAPTARLMASHAQMASHHGLYLSQDEEMTDPDADERAPESGDLEIVE